MVTAASLKDCSMELILRQIWVNLIKSWGHLKDVSATGCCLQIEQQPNLKFNNDNQRCLYPSTTFRWWKSFDCTFWPQPWWQRACQACLLILSWDFRNQSENIRRLLHGTNYHLEEMCSRSQKGNFRSFYWLTTPICLASFVLKVGWIQLSS